MSHLRQVVLVIFSVDDISLICSIMFLLIGPLASMRSLWCLVLGNQVVECCMLLLFVSLGPATWLMLQTCHGVHFLLSVVRTDADVGNEFSVLLRVVGDHHMVEKYRCR